jgi:hypothetical protein
LVSISLAEWLQKTDSGQPSRGGDMKHLQALLTFLLLILSKRYQQKWHRASEQLTENTGTIEASMRRIDAMENGGKPRIKVL